MLIYLCISVLFLLYTKQYRGRVAKGTLLVVLGSKYMEVFLDRIAYAQYLQKNLSGGSIYMTGKENIRGTKSFFLSKHTLDDAWQVQEVIDNRPFVLITSHAHMRRAYHTFCKVYSPEQIYCFPTQDCFAWYGPFTPLGWYAGLLNIMKDIRYNYVPQRCRTK